MINAQNRHGPQGDLMPGNGTIRGSTPSHPESYPLAPIIKPPGNRRTTALLRSQVCIACGLPVMSQPGCPDAQPPYMTHQPWDPAICLPGETQDDCCKGTSMRTKNPFSVLGSEFRVIILRTKRIDENAEHRTQNVERGTWNGNTERRTLNTYQTLNPKR